MQGISNIVWSFGTLQYAPRQLLLRLAEEANMRLHEFEAQQVCYVHVTSSDVCYSCRVHRELIRYTVQQLHDAATMSS